MSSPHTDRIAALMWLEYALEPKTCRESTGYGLMQCIEFAHALLQGPGGSAGVRRYYEAAVSATKEHERLADEECLKAAQTGGTQPAQ